MQLVQQYVSVVEAVCMLLQRAICPLKGSASMSLVRLSVRWHLDGECGKQPVHCTLHPLNSVSLPSYHSEASVASSHERQHHRRQH